MTVTESGSGNNKGLVFSFKNLKGAKGDKGATGEQGPKGDKGDAGTAFITRTWKSGTAWYRVWSDGWIEQGGHGSGGTCNLNRAFSNTEYTFVVQASMDDSSHPDWVAVYELRSRRTASNVSFAHYAGGDRGWDWYASGY